MKTLILITACLTIICTWAGDEVGNGGDAIVCPKDEKFLPTLLDFHESDDDLYTFVPIKGNDEFQIAKKAIKKLDKVSKKLADKYMRDLTAIRLKMKFIPDAKFRNVKDSYHISIPKDCEIKQAAIQRVHPITRELEIHINKDLYEKMPPLQKAGLITHEIIYSHFLFFGVRNSIKARIFNRYLFSQEILAHNQKHINKISEQLRIPLY